MKKFYVLSLLMLAVMFGAKAENYKFNFTIEEPEKVVIEKLDGFSQTLDSVYELQKGLNVIEVEVSSSEIAYLRVTPTQGNMLRMLKEDGSNDYEVKKNKWEKLMGMYDFSRITDYTRTIKVISEAEYRDKKVKVKVDEPSGVKVQLRDNESFVPTENEFEISYSSQFEDMIYVSPNAYGDVIYQVTADGVPVEYKNSSYDIALVDKSDEANPKYVEEIVIQKNFPEGFTCNIKIEANCDENAFTVTYGGEAVENILAEEGFNVTPGKELKIAVNTDLYEIKEVYFNDDKKYVSSYTKEFTQTITSDLVCKFDLEAYRTMEAVFVVDDPEAVIIETYSYPTTTLKLEKGENKVSFTQKQNSNTYTVKAVSDYELTEVYDETYEKEYVISGTVYVYLQENSKIRVKAEKIIRDKNVIVYIDDHQVGYGSVTLKRGNATTRAKKGYNTIDYRDKDGYISFDAYGFSGDLKLFQNGNEIEISTPSYFKVENPEDNDVIKVFFHAENAIEHTVKFNVTDDALDGYEVKKDIVTDVDYTADVAAVGKTCFTIAPVSRDNATLKVKVGETIVEPVDGVYTFETEGDTEITVSDSTSGIDAIVVGGNNKADVYNLQGIKVLRQASSDDLKSLPAGIYIINGRKVAVK